MRGIPTPSPHCSCAEPAPIFPYRPRPKTKKRSPNLQRKRHIRELGSSIARLSFLHPIAPVIMAVAPFMSLIAAATLVDSGARAQTPAHPPSIYRFANFIAEASARFTVPARWIRAIIQIESAGDERAISSRGAMGLMQLMPGTWVEPLRVFGSLQLGNWALGTSDRAVPPVIGWAVENPPSDHQLARLRSHRCRLSNVGGSAWNSSPDWTWAWTKPQFV